MDWLAVAAGSETESKNRFGSTAFPFSVVSKCRCAPVTLPVAPLNPISSPFATRCHRLTRIFDKCAYFDPIPPACPSLIRFP